MPDWKRFVTERLPPSVPPEVIEELAQHLEDRYRDLRSAGASEPEAMQKTAAELHDLRPIAAEFSESSRDVDAPPPGDARHANFFPDLARDLRYTARTIQKNPAFALFVIVTLALGIGANTMVFTLINTLILNPLPVPHPSELAPVTSLPPKSSAQAAALPISYADLKDFAAGNQVFQTLAGYTSVRVLTLQAESGAQRLFGEFVTGNYFAALGIEAAQGRFFSPDEDGAPGAHPVAVMNYATWQTRFGGAGNIVGKILPVDGVAVTVIGVAPPRFIGVNAVFGPDLWIPAAMAEQLLPMEMHNVLTDRTKAAFVGIGRLKPGVSRAQAQADFTGLAANLAREYPDADRGHGATVRPIQDVLFGADSSGTGRMPIAFVGAVLLAIVGIVLLIACSNIANLLLARAAAREQEIAIRLAVGASRGRLVRQLLTESMLLGLLGGLAGTAAALGGLKVLWSFGLTSANLVTPKIDPDVFAFTLLVSLASGFIFGVLPALKASRSGVSEMLKQQDHAVGSSPGKITLANALLVLQVAFSFVSLVTAALFLRSIERAYDIDPGFEVKHLAVLLPGRTDYPKPQARAFYKTVRERVATIPGVRSVAWASNMPLWGRLASGFKVDGWQPRSKGDTLTAIVNTVDTSYFATAGVAILQGRAFNDDDREDSLPVAIVNEKMARDYWPSGNALGKRIQLPNEKTMRRIAGIARTANYSALGEAPQACVYVPLEQDFSDAMALYVRTEGDPQRVLSAVQAQIRSLDPRIFADDARTGSTIVGQALFQAKMGVGLLGVFGLLALSLASVGLYGIVAYSVSRRRREIGVRIALGAAPSSVTGMIVGQGMSLVAAGVVLGFGAALLAGPVLAKMLYGVRSSDPLSVAAAAAVLCGVALLACYIPARRASRVDPLAALREG